MRGLGPSARPLLAAKWMPRLPLALAAALGLLLAWSAHAAAAGLDLTLESEDGPCNPDGSVSCVRYGGNTGFYPHGAVIALEDDPGGPGGGAVPVVTLDFFVPDVPQAFGDVQVDAPAEVPGSWEPTTGDLALGPFAVEFPNVVPGVVTLEGFALTTGSQPERDCGGRIIPAMQGSPMASDPPAWVRLVGSACVSVDGAAVPFFVVAAGEAVRVPEPGACALGLGSLLALGALRAATARRA